MPHGAVYLKDPELAQCIAGVMKNYPGPFQGVPGVLLPPARTRGGNSGKAFRTFQDTPDPDRLTWVDWKILRPIPFPNLIFGNPKLRKDLATIAGQTRRAYERIMEALDIPTPAPGRDATMIRLLHYPKIDGSASREKPPTRMGAHIDTTDLTLLKFDQPGLTIIDNEGEYLVTPPETDEVLVLLGFQAAEKSGLPAPIHRATQVGTGPRDVFTSFHGEISRDMGRQMEAIRELIGDLTI